MTTALLLFACLLPGVASQSIGSCGAYTAGTCKWFGCASSRGPTECVDGACVCGAGYCASQSGDTCECDPETGGTCKIFGCSGSRGHTDCIAGKCMCKPGTCSVDGKCMDALNEKFLSLMKAKAALSPLIKPNPAKLAAQDTKFNSTPIYILTGCLIVTVVAGVFYFRKPANWAYSSAPLLEGKTESDTRSNRRLARNILLVSAVAAMTLSGFMLLHGPKAADEVSLTSEWPDPIDGPGPGCIADWCQSKGYAEDACKCGVCGSNGDCSWSCNPINAKGGNGLSSCPTFPSPLLVGVWVVLGMVIIAGTVIMIYTGNTYVLFSSIRQCISTYHDHRAKKGNHHGHYNIPHREMQGEQWRLSVLCEACWAWIAERRRKLEEQVHATQAKVEEKEQDLEVSESQIAELQGQLKQLQLALDKSSNAREQERLAADANAKKLEEVEAERKAFGRTVQSEIAHLEGQLEQLHLALDESNAREQERLAADANARKAEQDMLDTVGLEYIERRVKIMSPTSDIWDRGELFNIKEYFAKVWPRLEAIFRNRNMAVCFLTNDGRLVEHGMFCDEKGKMNHICCTTDVHTGMDAQEVDPTDPTIGFTALCNSETGDVTAKAQLIKYIYEGPQREVCVHYATRREVPGVSVSRNMTDITSEYYGWHTIAVLIDAFHYERTYMVYSVCLHPTDLDGSEVVIRTAVAKNPQWEAIKTIAPSTEWSVKYCQYMAGYTDESQLINARITCLRQAISEAPVLSLKDALKPTFSLVREHFTKASYLEKRPESSSRMERAMRELRSSSSSSSSKRQLSLNVHEWSDDDFFESIDESIQNTREKLIELDLDGKFALEKAVAIHIYTKEAPPWYSCMNNILNDTDQFQSGKLGPKLLKFLPFIKLFQQALITLPEKFRFEGDVYRGEKRFYPSLYNWEEHDTKAKELIFYSPKSASKQHDIALDLTGQRGECTMFQIERSCSYSISAFSAHPHEEQVIIPMFSRFRCIDAEGFDEIAWVLLEEVNA